MSRFMMRIRKALNPTFLIIIFLCQNVAFCIVQDSSALRPPSHFSESTEAFIKNGENRAPGSIYEIGIGAGKEVVYKGSVEVIGERSQIKIQGKPEDRGQIVIGENLVIRDGFIAFRTTQGVAAVSVQDTNVVSKMEIGADVTVLDGAELINVPEVGNNVVIIGAPVVEFGEGEKVGNGARIVGNSEARMSSIGSHAVLDQQAKVFKAVVGDEARVINASVIGGHDELTPGWRQKDERGKGRGVVLEKKAVFQKALAYHKGASDGEEIKPIRIGERVELNGVFLVCEENKGIEVQASLSVPSGKRVYVHDGVTLNETLREEIQQLLQEHDVVVITHEDGRNEIRGIVEDVKDFDFQDVLVLKQRYKTEWTEDIPQRFSIQTVEQAQRLNDIVETHTVYVDDKQNVWIEDTDGHYKKVDLEVSISPEEIGKPGEIIVTIAQGCFVYPGLETYIKQGRKVTINLWEIGSRGGAVVVADNGDVHLGPKDRSAGRVAAAVIRDVNVDAEFNCFGGIADNVNGNAKLTIRNQGILRNAILRKIGEGKGEIIWGWYQGEGVEIEVHGDENIGLRHHGLIRGKPLSGSDSYSIKLGPHFQGGYWCSLIDRRVEPSTWHVFNNPLQDGITENITVPLRSIKEQQRYL